MVAVQVTERNGGMDREGTYRDMETCRDKKRMEYDDDGMGAEMLPTSMG